MYFPWATGVSCLILCNQVIWLFVFNFSFACLSPVVWLLCLYKHLEHAHTCSSELKYSKNFKINSANEEGRNNCALCLCLKCMDYDMKNHFRLFERPFKIQKNGIFLFEISFSILELLADVSLLCKLEQWWRHIVLQLKNGKILNKQYL